MRIELASERALILYTEETPTEKTIGHLQHLTRAIEKSLGPWLVGIIPSYQSILIVFDPLQTDHQKVEQIVLTTAQQQVSAKPPLLTGKLVRLPVYYGEECGPDLQRIAQLHKMKVEEVITAHCMNIYRVFAIGFAPGFGYLGDVDDSIATPRLSTPRASVPKGAVAIADRQTAVYPKSSPGGWNIIGNCPSVLFDPQNSPAIPFTVGDRIQFMPINAEEFRYLGGEL